MARRRRAAALALAGAALAWGALGAACDAGGGGTAGNLGVEGASCLRSPDCAPPLQCLANVCAPAGGGGAADAAGGAADADGLAAEAGDGAAADLPRVTDIPERVDLAAYDLHADDAADLGPGADIAAAADTARPPAFSDCEELGIPASWAGDFAGVIDFDVDAGELPVYPRQGMIVTGGDLAFEIACIDKKLVVQGQMSGSGAVLGREAEGDFPFELGLTGFYSPSTGKLDAKIVDGVVEIYGIVEVYFTGDFVGKLAAAKTFNGTWSGSATETNLPELITGVATGSGTWTADGT